MTTCAANEYRDISLAVNNVAQKTLEADAAMTTVGG
jgi:hypothetical protein